MSQFDDYDDVPGSRSRPMPGGVKAAGIIWIGFGVLGLAIAALGLALNVGAAAAGQGPAGDSCGNICFIAFAIAFLMCGIQTVRGTATGTLGNGIGSIVFGLLYSAGTVFMVVGAANMNVAGAAPALFIGAAFLGMLAVALLVAGILAIVGREAYAQWRIDQGLVKANKRPKTQEEDDYEDQDDDRRRRPREDEPRRLRDDDDRPRRKRPEDDDD